MITPETLNALLEVCRKHGVRSFTSPEVSFRLTADAPKAPPIESTPIEAVPTSDGIADDCPCGHPVWQHSDAGCLEGCQIGRCTIGFDDERGD